MKQILQWGAALIAIAFLVSGCAQLSGAAAGLGVAALGQAAGVAQDVVAQDVAEAAAYRARMNDLVVRITMRLEARAVLLEADDWAAAVKVYNAIWELNRKAAPKIAAVRLREQLGRGDQVDAGALLELDVGARSTPLAAAEATP